MHPNTKIYYNRSEESHNFKKYWTYLTIYDKTNSNHILYSEFILILRNIWFINGISLILYVYFSFLISHLNLPLSPSLSLCGSCLCVCALYNLGFVFPNLCIGSLFDNTVIEFIPKTHILPSNVKGFLQAIFSKIWKLARVYKLILCFLK